MAKYNFETNILRDSDHDYMEYGTSECKFVNQLRKLAESHPDEVTIVKDDGNYIYAHVAAELVQSTEAANQARVH